MLWLNEPSAAVFRKEAECLARDEPPEGGYKTIIAGSDYERTLRGCRDKNARANAADRQFEAGAVRALTYIADAEAYSLKQDSDDEYKTIPKNSPYSRRLDGCRSESELRYNAIAQCETDALDLCKKSALNALVNEEADDSSYVILLAQTKDFPSRFFETVVPAIERGFQSERYRSTEIERFTQTLNSLIYRAHICLLKDDDIEPFRKFVRILFAGLIYGPNHPLALDLRTGPTPSFEESGCGNYDRDEGTTIRLTQIFDDRGIHTGYSELFRPSQVVFFGRSSRTQEYLSRVSELFPDDSEIETRLQQSQVVLFPIILHPTVGRVHGMLVCAGDVWRFYDLKSTNGSCIVSREGTTPVDHLIELRPGDYLRLGAPADVDDTDVNLFMDAATIMVSSHVDLTEDYV